MIAVENRNSFVIARIMGFLRLFFFLFPIVSFCSDIISPQIKYPFEAEDRSGFFKTQNNFGYMVSKLDPISEAWVRFSAEKANRYALEIGAAFGIATHAALANGVTRVFANDICEKHLQILKDLTPLDQQGRLVTLIGDLSKASLAPNSYDSILISRVLHLLAPQHGEKILEKARKALVPNGRIFATVESPYWATTKSFIGTYERRKAMGEEYPGYIDSLAQLDPSHRGQMPEKVNLMDCDVFRNMFEKAGLKVIQCFGFTPPVIDKFGNRFILDGRETTGIIAEKIE